VWLFAKDGEISQVASVFNVFFFPQPSKVSQAGLSHLVFLLLPKDGELQSS